MKIATGIARLIEEKIAFTDINMREGMPAFYRSPTGYKPMDDTPLTKDDVEEFAELADGLWRKRLEDGGGQFDTAFTYLDLVRLRCNIFRFGHNNLVGAVIRKLPIDVPDIDELGAAPGLKHLAMTQSKGLILMAGPTGSGKSTTLAALIDYLNANKPLSIITVEQPIEYLFKQKMSVITQREVPTNVSTFQKGVESSKRQDPDVIMVGEVRDRETMDACLMAALSGHLVLATTHARNAQESVESMIGYYSGEEATQARHRIANALIAINSQVLVPSVDGLEFMLGYELLMNTGPVTNMLRDGKTRELGSSFSGGGVANKNIRLNECLAKMVKGKKISREAALVNTYDSDDLQKALATP